MEEHINQNCPLCGKIASFVFKDYQQYKLFSCTVCKVFVIPEQQEEFIKSRDQSLRSQFSNTSSKLSSDMLLQISVELVGNSPQIFPNKVLRANWH